MVLGETPVRVAHVEHANCFAVATMAVSHDDNPTSYIRYVGWGVCAADSKWPLSAGCWCVSDVIICLIADCSLASLRDGATWEEPIGSAFQLKETESVCCLRVVKYKKAGSDIAVRTFIEARLTYHRH